MQNEKLRIPSDSTSSASTTSISSESTIEDTRTFDEKLIDFLAQAIESVARKGDSSISLPALTSYHYLSRHQNKQSLSQNLKRIIKRIDCSKGSLSWNSLSSGAKALVSSIIYVDRISTKTLIDSQKIYRFIAVGMLVALKMNEDAFVDMHFFSSLCGIDFIELRELESFFLEKLRWDVVISEQEFTKQVATFERLSSSKKSRKQFKEKNDQKPL